jgi:hypothetical protein
LLIIIAGIIKQMGINPTTNLDINPKAKEMVKIKIHLWFFSKNILQMEINESRIKNVRTDS